MKYKLRKMLGRSMVNNIEFFMNVVSLLYVPLQQVSEPFQYLFSFYFVHHLKTYSFKCLNGEIFPFCCSRAAAYLCTRNGFLSENPKSGKSVAIYGMMGAKTHESIQLYTTKLKRLCCCNVKFNLRMT